MQELRTFKQLPKIAGTFYKKVVHLLSQNLTQLTKSDTQSKEGPLAQREEFE